MIDPREFLHLSQGRRASTLLPTGHPLSVHLKPLRHEINRVAVFPPRPGEHGRRHRNWQRGRHVRTVSKLASDFRASESPVDHPDQPCMVAVLSRRSHAKAEGQPSIPEEAVVVPELLEQLLPCRHESVLGACVYSEL